LIIFFFNFFNILDLNKKPWLEVLTNVFQNEVNFLYFLVKDYLIHNNYVLYFIVVSVKVLLFYITSVCNVKFITI